MKKNKLFLLPLLIFLSFTHMGFGRHKKQVSEAIPSSGQQSCPAPNQDPVETQVEATLNTAVAAVHKTQTIQCQSLQTGESRLVVASDEQSPTSVHHLYKLIKKTDNEYEVVLNLKYRSSGSAEDQATDDKFHQLAARCYQEADRGLVGPDGEHLHIRLAAADEANPPPVHFINVIEGNQRGDADDYNSKSFDCATILHESLHLMGLVDEYKEEKIGLALDPSAPSGKIWLRNSPNPGWDCRSVGDSDSIMTDMEAAWTKSFGQVRMTDYQLDCICNSPKCKKAFIHPDPNSRDCPTGAQDKVHQIFPENTENVTPGINILSPSHFVITRDVRTFTGESLLKPAHFASIVHPGCVENLPYYQCAENAYKTSKEHNGDGCIAVPSFCHDGTANWTKGGK